MVKVKADALDKVKGVFLKVSTTLWWKLKDSFFESRKESDYLFQPPYGES